MDDTDQKLKSGHHPLFIPNIPFFQHSIIPLDSYQFSFAQNAQKKFRHLCKPKPYKRLQRLNLVSTFFILYISGLFGWRIDNLILVVLNVVVKLNR
jgi:hypothetical protein